MQQLLNLLPMKPVRCPHCRVNINGTDVWFYRNCVVCGAVFRIRPLYILSIQLLAVAFSTGLAFAVGNRGYPLFALAALLVLPMYLGILTINIRLFPPDIKVVREGWTPGDSEEDRSLDQLLSALREHDVVISRDEPSEVAVSMLEESKDVTPGRPPISTPRDPPLSLEGIVIGIAAVGELVFLVYQALEPHLKNR